MSDDLKSWQQPGLGVNDRAQVLLVALRNTLDPWHSLVVETIESALADALPKWTRVEEGLPEMGRALWLYLQGGSRVKGRYSGSQKSAYYGLFWDQEGTYDPGMVTHWQYEVVPEPPKE